MTLVFGSSTAEWYPAPIARTDQDAHSQRNGQEHDQHAEIERDPERAVVASCNARLGALLGTGPSLRSLDKTVGRT